MASVMSTPPPDDSGTDAFQRYVYQAHVALPFCVACYFEDAVVAIYCEHWEDLLIEYADRFRFTQIKTRDPGRGPWRFRHLLEDGGALHSLARTHVALAEIEVDRAVEYEVRLEGAIQSGDEDLARLLVGGDGPTEEMCSRCAERLGLEADEARELLARVTVRPNQPPRTLIEAHNREELRLIAGHLAANELKEIYDAAIGLFKRAMEADLLADAWPRVILEPQSADEAARQRAHAKRIDRDALEPILNRLEGGGHRPLVAITDPDRLRATALERKLMAAGARSELIERAKEFRAQASIRMAEVRGGSLFEVDTVVADLETRLLNTAEAIAGATASDPSGSEIWSQLDQRLSANPASFDPSRVLGQDHLLLLGQVCQLSDECRFRWGAE